MKKILFVLAAIAASASVHASYLYWQIDGSEGALSGKEYNGVRIYASRDGGAAEKIFLNLGYAEPDNGFQGIGYAVSAPLHGGSLVADLSDLSSPEGYSFYVELINSDLTYWNNAAHKSESAYQSSTAGFAGQLQGGDDITYTSLVSQGFIGADLSPVSMAVWHGGTQYSSVPEPTSAILMLIGIAGLALRRRAV